MNGLGVPLNQNQFDALVSLVYNCGAGAMQWQIGQDLRARKLRGGCGLLRPLRVRRWPRASGTRKPPCRRTGAISHARRIRRRKAPPSGAADHPPEHHAGRSIRNVHGHHFPIRPLGALGIPGVELTFQGDMLSLNERATVREFDRLSRAPLQDDALLAKHRLWLVVLRKRIWHVAHNPLGPDGQTDLVGGPSRRAVPGARAENEGPLVSRGGSRSI